VKNRPYATAGTAQLSGMTAILDDLFDSLSLLRFSSSEVVLLLSFGVLIYVAAKTGSSVLYRLAPATTSPDLKASAVFQPAHEAEPTLPDPTPLHDFDLATAHTRDYIYANKCVRWPYFQTMAHQPMDINDWIEIDKDYVFYINQKQQVIKEQGKIVLDSLLENDAAAGELLELVVSYLPKRYPTLFDCLQDGIYNKLTNKSFTGLNHLQGVQALQVVSNLTQCDFLMAREREDGHVHFTGGIVAFPGFYYLSDKIGKSMSQVHQPVPEFNEKLLISVERTLKRFQSHEPFERSSWEMVDDWNLFRHNLVDQPEDSKLRDELHPKDYLFRIDHQTFRKLPRTRGIIFGVHPILKRLEEFKNDPLVPALLKTIHEKGPNHLMKYKLAPMYQERMIPYLEELTKSQMERGLITGDEPIGEFRKYTYSRP